MLPFTRERLPSFEEIFYYNRHATMPEIQLFSNQIFQDLKEYLGIQFEINQRRKFADAIDDEGISKVYDDDKIGRIEALYDFYIDSILKFMQLLYYEYFDEHGIMCHSSATQVALAKLQNAKAKLKAKNYTGSEEEQAQQKIALKKIKTKERKVIADNKSSTDEKASFKLTFEQFTQKSGIPLSKCYDKSVEKCQPIKAIIDAQVNLEFPIKTFQDKVVSKEKKSMKKM